MNESITKVEGWRTSDGLVHGSKAAAKARQSIIELNAFVKAESVCSGGEWSKQMVAGWMIDNADRLSVLLLEIAEWKGFT